jgi:hypothetical protein
LACHPASSEKFIPDWDARHISDSAHTVKAVFPSISLREQQITSEEGDFMTATNGSTNGHDESSSIVSPVLGRPKKVHLSQTQVRTLLERLRVPFDPLLIQWKVVETTKAYGRFRGRIIPYADRLAYHERLNDLLTPVGWTQNISVLTGPIVPRERGRTESAKLVVTCQLTIHVLGSHSSTGEGWSIDDNAATSTEAQAFKRACSFFGLGAYLYYFFEGVWVDLDNNERPVSLPALPPWATPDGWLGGARPSIERVRDSSDGAPDGFDLSVIREIEAMHSELGAQVYRRILKGYKVWEPKQIPNPEIASKILADMKFAANRMMRGAYALEKLGRPAFTEIIATFGLKSVSEFGDLAILEKVVTALEDKVASLEPS